MKGIKFRPFSHYQGNSTYKSPPPPQCWVSGGRDFLKFCLGKYFGNCYGVIMNQLKMMNVCTQKYFRIIWVTNLETRCKITATFWEQALILMNTMLLREWRGEGVIGHKGLDLWPQLCNWVWQVELTKVHSPEKFGGCRWKEFQFMDKVKVCHFEWQ